MTFRRYTPGEDSSGLVLSGTGSLGSVQRSSDLSKSGQSSGTLREKVMGRKELVVPGWQWA